MFIWVVPTSPLTSCVALMKHQRCQLQPSSKLHNLFHVPQPTNTHSHSTQPSVWHWNGRKDGTPWASLCVQRRVCVFTKWGSTHITFGRREVRFTEKVKEEGESEWVTGIIQYNTSRRAWTKEMRSSQKEKEKKNKEAKQEDAKTTKPPWEEWLNKEGSSSLE